MKNIRYEITVYEDDEPVAGFDISPNQMELIHCALQEYQDAVYCEESIYFDEQDAADFSELQGNLAEL